MSVVITSNEPTETSITNTKDIESQYVTPEQKDAEPQDSDIDYNPNDDTDPESEEVSSDEASEIENKEPTSENEEEIVYSQEFQKELAAAIENVKYVAKIDKKTILERARHDYIAENGEEPTDKQMIDAFQTFVIESTQQEVEVTVSEDDAETIFQQEFADEFAEALEHIKKIGKIHQESFADRICNTFVELTGQEPTIEQLSNTFECIRNNFADEAREEFIEINNGESDSDSDYETTNEDVEQFEKDNQIDKRQKTEIVYVNDTDDYSDVSDVEQEEDDDSHDSEEDDDDSETYDPEQDIEDYSQDDKDYEAFKTELNGNDENEIECDDEDIIDID